MKMLKQLFENNKVWASKVTEENPEFFQILSKQQSPEYLWIGCSDSRVPANEIVNLLPGELFVHRNVANLVKHTDMNMLSVLQYAVEVLKVKHVIVCGHYGCGGVAASIEEQPHGLIDNWIRSIRDLYFQNLKDLNSIEDSKKKLDKLCELNVVRQVYNVCQTTIVQKAWKKEQQLTIHGWIYSIDNGLLKDLDVCISSNSEMDELLSS